MSLLLTHIPCYTPIDLCIVFQCKPYISRTMPCGNKTTFLELKQVQELGNRQNWKHIYCDISNFECRSIKLLCRKYQTGM